MESGHLEALLEKVRAIVDGPHASLLSGRNYMR
jgi:hypothetical protein